MKKINNTFPVVGIGAANAFPLITPAYFLDKYAIACIRKRKDLDLIKKDFDVFCLEEDDPQNSAVPRTNPGELLKIDSTREFIQKFGKTLLFSRKTTPGIQKFSKENHLKLLGNEKEIRDVYENKFYFRQTLIDCGLNPIPGAVAKFEDATWQWVQSLKEKFGNKIVLQAAELVYGGGVGTAFIENENDFNIYMERMKKIKYSPEVPRNIQHIILTKFVEGTPSSVIGVSTKHGVICGSIQTQLQDIADVSYPGKGSGIYCGHDWSYKRYSEEIIAKVKKITKTFGTYIYKKGYKGIFGLDLLIDENKNEVFPVECNPRYTDALPVLSLLAKKKQLTPLEYYHFAEHMGIEYELDVDDLSSEYLEGFEGSQILLMSKTDKPTTNHGELEAGIYIFENGKLKFQRHSYYPGDIKDNGEFLLTDGVPYKGTYFKKMARIMRVIFPISVLMGDKKLKPHISEIVNQIYTDLDFRQTNPRHIYNSK